MMAANRLPAEIVDNILENYEEASITWFEHLVLRQEPIWQILRRVNRMFRSRIPFGKGTERHYDHFFEDQLGRIELHHTSLLVEDHLPCYACQNVRHKQRFDDVEVRRLPMPNEIVSQDGGIKERKCTDCKLKLDLPDGASPLQHLVTFDVGGVSIVRCPWCERMAFHQDLPAPRRGFCSMLQVHIRQWCLQRQDQAQRQPLGNELYARWRDQTHRRIDWNRI